jgi:hypothetical protein
VSHWDNHYLSLRLTYLIPLAKYAQQLLAIKDYVLDDWCKSLLMQTLLMEAKGD